MKRLGPAVALLVAAGCLVARRPGLDRAPSQREVDRVARGAISAALSGRAVACGSRPRRGDLNLLVVTAEVCLGCRQIGYLIRRLAADSLRETVVVAPPGQGSVVCDYLARERVDVAVAFGDSVLFGGHRFLERRFVVVRSDAGGGVRSAVAGRDPVEVLSVESPMGYLNQPRQRSGR